jgi:hypothetical protein
MLHSGINLHKNDLVIDTLDASGNAVAHRRLRAERPLVARYFRSSSWRIAVQQQETMPIAVGVAKR